MGQRLFTLAAALSLAFLGIAIVLWVKAGSSWEWIEFAPRDVRLTGSTVEWATLVAGTGTRGLLLAKKVDAAQYPSAGDAGEIADELRRSHAEWRRDALPDDVEQMVLRARGIHGPNTFVVDGVLDFYVMPSGASALGAPVSHEFLVVLPYWVLIAVSAPAPAVWLTLFWRRRRNAHSQLCTRCGYDLRASPDRCPECGSDVVQSR